MVSSPHFIYTHVGNDTLHCNNTEQRGGGGFYWPEHDEELQNRITNTIKKFYDDYGGTQQRMNKTRTISFRLDLFCPNLKLKPK